jgi:ribulose-5-phosphate 4-epimerase/fuculose-1-phosphate aldolase
MPGGYEFVKFDPVLVTSAVLPQKEVRDLRDVCNSLHQAGLVEPYHAPEGFDVPDGSNGNVSRRLTSYGSMVITATQLKSKENLTGRNFVIVERYVLPKDPNEKGVAYCHGRRAPSSESILHWYFYRRRPSVGGIIHAHESTELLYSKRSRDVWPELGITQTLRKGEEGTLDLPISVNEVLANLQQYTVLLDHNPSWDEEHTGTLVLAKTLEEASERVLDVHQKLLGANRSYQGASLQ